MAATIPFGSSGLGAARRWFAGVAVSRQCTELAAALVEVAGHGLAARVQLVAAASAAAPREVSAAFAAWDSPADCSVAALGCFRSLLADAQAALIASLTSQCGVPPTRILAVGVHDPGLWTVEHCGTRPVRGFVGLSDPARLAEATGLNIIDDFPSRDVSQGGLGGPLTPLPEWIILRQPKHSQVLLKLGRSITVTFLPASNRGPHPQQAIDRIQSFEAGPGTALLDVLAQKLTGGACSYDPGGRLAVQGKCIPQLVEHWLADPYFDTPLPRWHPRGVHPQRFLADAMQMAVAKGWSIRDMLCSATHFLAQATVQSMRRRLPDIDQAERIIVAGGGQHNGLLLRKIAELASLPIVRLAECGFAQPEALEPACVAVLAMLHVDQLPANLVAVTGAQAPRLLGRLTPGAPQQWQRLLQTAAERLPQTTPLRMAM